MAFFFLIGFIVYAAAITQVHGRYVETTYCETVVNPKFNPHPHPHPHPSPLTFTLTLIFEFTVVNLWPNKY